MKTKQPGKGFCIYLLYSNRNFRPTLLAVLEIQDVKPGSRFFYIQDPGSWILKVFLTVKFIKKTLKNMDWIRDLGSEIWDLEKNLSRILDPDPPVKKHCILDPGSGLATLRAAWLSYGAAWLNMVRRGLVWCAVA